MKKKTTSERLDAIEQILVLMCRRNKKYNGVFCNYCNEPSIDIMVFATLVDSYTVGYCADHEERAREAYEKNRKAMMNLWEQTSTHKDTIHIPEDDNE